jgi:hypothetical protein
VSQVTYSACQIFALGHDDDEYDPTTTSNAGVDTPYKPFGLIPALKRGCKSHFDMSAFQQNVQREKNSIISDFIKECKFVSRISHFQYCSQITISGSIRLHKLSIGCVTS